MLKLGCIADDFSAARDLANSLVTAGMRVTQTLGVPRTPLDLLADAAVVTLKSRYSRPGDAVVRALDALVWLKTQGAKHFYFCFSPTFDSLFNGNTRGNIGPVVEALMNALGADFTVVVPAFPDHGIALLKGHLFVNGALLSESAMASHPRTPMTNSNLLRVLQAQTTHQVALIDHLAVNASSVEVQERMVQLRLSELRVALIDAATNDDLMRIGHAVKGLALATGSAGLGLALPQNFDIAPSTAARHLPRPKGRGAVLCGSCTETSNRQVQYFHAAGHPAMALDPLKVSKFGADKVAQAALAWATPLLAKGPVLLYSTADEASKEAVKNLLGVNNAGLLIEQCMAHIARGMVALGVRQLVMGGTDTGVACLRGIGLRQLQIGPQIEPGVPWSYSPLTVDDPDGLHLVVKPGALGTDDFFARAFDWTR